ncbi:hypothetical protein MTR67_000959 [Solanum verrucosum]|uniref:Uncharacterized protein n=1 Tax=Solanum verrucosum TaxID=315347 RepID=A0AAF0PMB3_SOLVR|nr:hypothetical protein MTR67_000959 [Solanum verrucosum]
MHITATSKFCLLRRSSLVGAVQPQGFVVVVVVDIVVRTEEAVTVVADGRAAKEGEQTKALVMPLMEVN